MEQIPGDISQPRDGVRRELESALEAALRKGVKSAFNTQPPPPHPIVPKVKR